MQPLEIFIGRQPIYDRALDVFAYELLYRSGETDRAGELDGDAATSQVLLNTFTEIGLEHLVGDHLAFINLTRPFIMGENPLPLPEGRIVLEILEDIVVDAQLVDAVRKLSASGYLIALDDFIYHESLRPLVDLADFIKIDVRQLDRHTVRDHVTQLRPHRARLLAEKVETLEEFEYYRDLGFDYFQGYFFCRPKVIRGHRMPSNRLATMRLLSRLQDPQVQVDELESIISQDVSLSYRLLRYINSPFFGLAHNVGTIHQAVVYLGNRTLKTWITLVALAGIDDKPHELMTIALVRGRMCELLAGSLKLRNKETFFVVGLFSALDALLDAPMEEVVRTLPLSDEVVAALLRREGLAGEILQDTLAYERGDWDGVKCRRLDPRTVKTAYLDAVTWADRTVHEITT